MRLLIYIFCETLRNVFSSYKLDEWLYSYMQEIIRYELISRIRLYTPVGIIIWERNVIGQIDISHCGNKQVLAAERWQKISKNSPEITILLDWVHPQGPVYMRQQIARYTVEKHVVVYPMNISVLVSWSHVSSL